jgi:ketosteroid isomerase-like protein
MPGGNAERFHRIYEEWYERRRLGPGLLAEDAEWVNPHDAVEAGTRRGAGSFNEAIGRVFDAWKDVRFEADQVIERGQDVIALGRLRNRGRTAGMEVSQPHGQIWTFRDGKAVRMRWFNSHEETLEAADSSE